eukprot:CAMPEP_0178423292 /NCGR_PEP_ID=MMETSP0689_2-20121128/27612_1 /TAXON_ID=160604 /ORGANISM="Amphidinium massartii, Strain CS-259" /LENGTH=489 /DNA_ID=CAMNT_0020044879 /DNA_START=34 /DNA_END=1503 /DNA_ORIENTATION=+
MDAAAPFSIHGEPWHLFWLAATQKRSSHIKVDTPDVKVESVVEKFLEEHGPASPNPLTLRMYGMMLKGFCIVDNSQSQVLYNGCERLVRRFSQNPSGAQGQALALPTGAGKKGASRPGDLDLAISKVQADDALDWTQAQAPFEIKFVQAQLDTQNEGMSLELPQEPVALWEDGKLFDEALPPLQQFLASDQELPAPLATNAVEYFGIEEKAAAAAAEEQAPRMEPLLSELLVDGNVAPKDGQQTADAGMPPPVPEQPLATAPRGKFSRAPLCPGVVLGFDQDTEMDDSAAGVFTKQHRLSPAETAALLLPKVNTCEHLGALVDILELPDPVYGPALTPEAMFGFPEGTEPGPAGMQPEELISGAGAVDQGMAMDLNAGLNGDVPMQGEMPESAHVDAAVLAGLSKTTSAEVEVDSVNHDKQTREVGNIIRQCLGQSKAHALHFHDLLQPSHADKATAAMTFLSVLTLATAGDLKASQASPYGPISLTLP